jgi:hypothetical protein
MRTIEDISSNKLIRIQGLIVRKGNFITCKSFDDDYWLMRYDGLINDRTIMSNIGCLSIDRDYPRPNYHTYNRNGVISIEDIISCEMMSELDKQLLLKEYESIQ